MQPRGGRLESLQGRRAGGRGRGPDGGWRFAVGRARRANGCPARGGSEHSTAEEGGRVPASRWCLASGFPSQTSFQFPTFSLLCRGDRGCPSESTRALLTGLHQIVMATAGSRAWSCGQPECLVPDLGGEFSAKSTGELTLRLWFRTLALEIAVGNVAFDKPDPEICVSVRFALLACRDIGQVWGVGGDVFVFLWEVCLFRCPSTWCRFSGRLPVLCRQVPVWGPHGQKVLARRASYRVPCKLPASRSVTAALSPWTLLTLHTHTPVLPSHQPHPIPINPSCDSIVHGHLYQSLLHRKLSKTYTHRRALTAASHALPAPTRRAQTLPLDHAAYRHAPFPPSAAVTTGECSSLRSVCNHVGRADN